MKWTIGCLLAFFVGVSFAQESPRDGITSAVIYGDVKIAEAEFSALRDMLRMPLMQKWTTQPEQGASIHEAGACVLAIGRTYALPSDVDAILIARQASAILLLSLDSTLDLALIRRLANAPGAEGAEAVVVLQAPSR